jgi:PAS domain S-box-containing protein
MGKTQTIELSKAMLHRTHHGTVGEQPIVRGDLPESVNDALDVPQSLAGCEGDETVRILYVDDNSELTELTKIYLEKEQEEFSVETTTNAVEAIESLQETEYDCIVSDYDMPNTDGIELLKIVRETHPNLPYVLFTAKGAESIASEAFSAGATDYMQKDVGNEQYEILADRIRSAVEQYRTQQYFWNALSWYQTLVEQNFTGVFIIKDGEFFFVNQKLADMLGYYRSDLVGMSPTELASTLDDEKRLQELVEFERNPGGTFHVDTTVSTRNGDDLAVEIQGGVIRHDDDIGCIGLFWRQPP